MDNSATSKRRFKKLGTDKTYSALSALFIEIGQVPNVHTAAVRGGPPSYA